MTIRYISPANDGGFNASGISTVQIQVPYGQYWLPRLIKVGLAGNPGELNIRPFEPRLMTKLYHGNPTDVSPGAFVDSTVNTVTGDVTAILNGTMLQPGEWLTAITSTLNNDVWTQGLVYLELDGLTSDNIAEAAQLIVSSVPGLPFQGQLSYPTVMPPMPDRSVLAVFNNPGQTNTVNILGSPPNTNLFIYNVSTFGQNVAFTDGALQPIPPVSPPGVLTDRFNYYNPGTANAAINYAQEYHGYQMLPSGLQWVQTGSAAVNTGSLGLSVTYRFMNI